eukprot:UN26501
MPRTVFSPYREINTAKSTWYTYDVKAGMYVIERLGMLHQNHIIPRQTTREDFYKMYNSNNPNNVNNNQNHPGNNSDHRNNGKPRKYHKNRHGAGNQNRDYRQSGERKLNVNKPKQKQAET